LRNQQRNRLGDALLFVVRGHQHRNARSRRGWPRFGRFLGVNSQQNLCREHGTGSRNQPGE
jgi:hypothetical protein